MAETVSKAQIELTAIDNATAVIKKVGGAVGDVGASFGKFTGLISGAAAAFGLFKVADGFSQWVKGAAALDDFAERTGATVEGLSGMRSLIKVVGGDMEQMVGLLEKLAKSMSESLGSSTANSARAFAQLGISVTDAQGNLRKTDQVMLEFAQKLNTFEDGAGKTAIAMAVLGKSGAQMLPTLKHMGELTEFQTKLTAAQAEQAENLEITWKKLALTFEGGSKTIYAAAMPAISAFSEALLDVATSAKKGQGGIEDLAKDGSLADWAQKAVIGVAYVVDIFQGLWGIIKTVGQAIGAIMAHGMNVASTLGDAFVAIVKANYSELPDIVRRGTNAMRSINAEFAADFQENLFPKELFSDKVKARMALQAQAAGKEIKKNLNFALKEDKGEKDIVDHLGKSLDDLFNKLSSPIDPELMKDIALLTKGFQLGRISIDAYAFGLLEATRQSKSFKDANDEIAKSLKENEDALNKNRQAVEDAMQALKDHIRGIDEEIGAIGLSKVERERYNLQLKRTADLRRIDATLSGEEAEMRRAEVDAFYNAAEAAVVYRGRLEEQHDAFRSLGEAATSFFEDLFQNGTRAFGNLWSNIKRFFAQLAAQFTVKYVLGLDVQGGALGTLGGLLGGGGAGGLGILGSLFGGAGAFGASASGAFQNVLGSLFGTGGGLMEGIGSIFAGVSGGISGIMGGSILSGLGQIAGALGPIGAVVAGITALVNIFAKDEKGFKFDNSLRNVAAAPANVQQAMLGNFAPSGDVDGKLLGAIQPFITKVQALDKYIATNLLSEESLAQVRERIQQLQNPRWWNLEDPQAVEKASKYFLQQRYSEAFKPINAAFADAIASFSGTADELLNFIDTFIITRKAIDDARAAAAGFASAITGDVQDALDQQSNNVLFAYRAQVRVVDQLLAISPSATDALGQLVTGMAGVRSAAVQMMLQFAQVRASMDSMFSDAIRNIELSVLNPQQQYDYLQQEADMLAAQARASTDPLQIQSLLQRILGDVSQAQGLLSPEQRAALAPEQIARLRDLQTELQGRIADLQGAAQNQMQDLIGKLADKLEEVSAAQLAAAQTQQTAADTQLTAARTPNQLNVSIDLVNGTATITQPPEVGG